MFVIIVEKKVSGWQTGFYDRQKIETEIFPSLLQTSKATYFPPSLWAKAFKRSIYQQQQLTDTIVNMGEDTACTIPTIYHSQSLYISDECDYFYRINPSSMTQNRKPFMTDGPKIITTIYSNNWILISSIFKNNYIEKQFGGYFLS